jgi:hypothetical protein
MSLQWTGWSAEESQTNQGVLEVEAQPTPPYLVAFFDFL